MESKKIEIQNLFDQQDDYVKERNAEHLPDQTVQEDLQATLMELELEVQHAKERANQIITEAEREAEQTRESITLQQKQFEIQIQEERNTAREKGYEEGFIQGQEEGFSTYSQLIEQAKTVIRQSEQEYGRTIESAQPIIVELAAALAQRMVNQKFEEDQDMWSQLLLQVMTEVREHENVRIYVHPDWFERTTQQKDELEQMLSHTEKLFIYPDAGLMKNGCVIETKYGRIDATIDRQLTELKSQLLEKVKEGDNERAEIS